MDYKAAMILRERRQQIFLSDVKVDVTGVRRYIYSRPNIKIHMLMSTEIMKGACWIIRVR